MRRRLLNLLTALSMLLCVAVVALWGLSQFDWYRVVYWSGADKEFVIGSWGHWLVFGTHPGGYLRWHEFGVRAMARGDPCPRWPVLAVPHAVAALVLAWPVPLILAPRVRRAVTAGRSRRGFCPSCGYDLRATPGRCPECGHAAP